MARQSITLTKPNDEWLNELVMKNEYASKSEIVNDLIRRARKEDEEKAFIRAKLIEAEASGVTQQTKSEILAEFRKELGLNG